MAGSSVVDFTDQAQGRASLSQQPPSGARKFPKAPAQGKSLPKLPPAPQAIGARLEWGCSMLLIRWSFGTCSYPYKTPWGGLGRPSGAGGPSSGVPEAPGSAWSPPPRPPNCFHLSPGRTGPSAAGPAWQGGCSFNQLSSHFPWKSKLQVAPRNFPGFSLSLISPAKWRLFAEPGIGSGADARSGSGSAWLAGGVGAAGGLAPLLLLPFALTQAGQRFSRIQIGS